MKRILTILAAGVVLFGCNAFAASTNDPIRDFGAADMNRDGSVTWDEFRVFFPFADERKFKEADIDKNGKIDQGEWILFKDRFDYGNRPRR